MTTTTRRRSIIPMRTSCKPPFLFCLHFFHSCLFSFFVIIFLRSLPLPHPLCFLLLLPRHSKFIFLAVHLNNVVVISKWSCTYAWIGVLWVRDAEHLSEDIVRAARLLFSSFARLFPQGWFPCSFFCVLWCCTCTEINAPYLANDIIILKFPAHFLFSAVVPHIYIYTHTSGGKLHFFGIELTLTDEKGKQENLAVWAHREY